VSNTTVSLAGVLVATLATVLIVAGAAVGSPDLSGHRTIRLGQSVHGRQITVIETGDFDSPDKVLVVGCIHGNECAGTAVAAQLARNTPPQELDLWIIPNLNPDGAAAGTRTNAHGVDLNRNFPWRWRHLDGPYYSGPHPLSEPESLIADKLILIIRPRIAIWFHQHLDVVDESGGNLTIESRFAALAGMRLTRLAREPGSVVGWENHHVRSGTAFVVELPPGSLSAAAPARFAHAIIAVARTTTQPT
jgi:protein MpaA